MCWDRIQRSRLQRLAALRHAGRRRRPLPSPLRDPTVPGAPGRRLHTLVAEPHGQREAVAPRRRTRDVGGRVGKPRVAAQAPPPAGPGPRSPASPARAPRSSAGPRPLLRRPPRVAGRVEGVGPPPPATGRPVARRGLLARQVCPVVAGRVRDVDVPEEGETVGARPRSGILPGPGAREVDLRGSVQSRGEEGEAGVSREVVAPYTGAVVLVERREAAPEVLHRPRVPRGPGDQVLRLRRLGVRAGSGGPDGEP